MPRNFGLGALADGSNAFDSEEPRLNRASLYVYRVNSLIVSYEDRREAEEMISSVDIPPPWRMNLVATSKKYLFIASGSKIFIKKITMDGLKPFACLRLRCLPGSREADESEDEERQLVNSIRVGMVGEREVLVSVDTLAMVNVWDAGTLAELSLFFVQKSAWSIAFNSSEEKLIVGSNTHHLTVLDLSNASVAPVVHRDHTHNTPSVDCDGEFLVSASIDGTCKIRHLQTGEVKIVVVQNWCWACRIIRWEEVERVGDFGQLGRTFRIQHIHRNYTSTTSTQERRALINQGGVVEQVDSWNDYSAEEMEEDPDLFPVDAGGLEAEEETESEMRQLVWQDAWDLGDDSMENEEEISSEQSFESDTGFLSRQRLGRVTSVGSEEENFTSTTSADEEIYHQETDEPQYRHGGPEQESIDDQNESEQLIEWNDFIALTTNSRLMLILLREGRVVVDIALDEVLRSGHQIEDPVTLQFNRFCMMQWVGGTLSCLFLANQNGHMIILHVLREDGQIRLSGSVIDSIPVAPMAGFTVFECLDVHPMGRREWKLYILYLDGTTVTVRIDRSFNDLDLTRLYLS